MKIYFAASIYYRERMIDQYKTIIKHLKRLGITQIFSEDTLTISLDEVLDEDDAERKKWFVTWRKFISKADFAVVEMSYPSTVNIGFEIAMILKQGEPVIALYEEGKDPIFTSELHSKKLIKSAYTLNTLPTVLDWAVSEAKEIINKRFTFIIPPDINNFLEIINRTKRTTASDYIRSLIRRDMKLARKKNR